MEQNLVDTSVVVANEPAQADAAGSNEVTLSDLIIDANDGGTADTAPQVDEPARPEARDGDAEQPVDIKNQKDFNRAFKLRTEEIRERERARYEASDEYQFGRALLQDRATRDGITVQEARRRYEAERISSKAEEYQQDPKKFYEDFVRSQYAQPVRQPQPEQQPQPNPPQMIARQLYDAKQNGVLPESFTPADVTPDFILTLQQKGIYEAASKWAEAQAPFVSAASVADELERRRYAPRPMKPSGQNPGIGGTPDFSRMSEDQFKKYDAAIEKAAMEGKRVRF